MTQEQMDLYLWRLAAIDSDLLRAAVVHLIDTWGYSMPPPIAKIRETAMALDTSLKAPTPLEAWGLVRLKKYRDSPWGSIMEKAVQDAVGWHQLENGSAADMSWHRKAFIERYEELLLKDEGPSPDVRQMLENYRMRIEKLLPRSQEPRPIIAIQPTFEDPTPAKPLGSIMAAYKDQLAKINPDELVRLQAKEKAHG